MIHDRTTPLEPVASPTAELERRLNQLEDVVASLCDTSSLEKRIADQVASRLTQHELLLPPLPPPAPSNAPTAAVARPAPLATFAEPPPTRGAAPPLWSRLFAGWVSEHSLIRDLWWDLRMFWRMLRDPGYTTSLACKIGPLAILIYVFILPKIAQYVNWLFPSVQLGIIGIFLDVLLLYVAFKIVHRELRRYHDYRTRFR
jgi:hypothetical protein